jgi:hypothetical protein
VNSILRKISGLSLFPPFRYFDKGSLAVRGKNFAILPPPPKNL